MNIFQNRKRPGDPGYDPLVDGDGTKEEQQMVPIQGSVAEALRSIPMELPPMREGQPMDSVAYEIAAHQPPPSLSEQYGLPPGPALEPFPEKYIPPKPTVKGALKQVGLGMIPFVGPTYQHMKDEQQKYDLAQWVSRNKQIQDQYEFQQSLFKPAIQDDMKAQQEDHRFIQRWSFFGVTAPWMTPVQRYNAAKGNSINEAPRDNPKQMGNYRLSNIPNGQPFSAVFDPINPMFVDAGSMGKIPIDQVVRVTGTPAREPSFQKDDYFTIPGQEEPVLTRFNPVMGRTELQTGAPLPQGAVPYKTPTGYSSSPDDIKEAAVGIIEGRLNPDLTKYSFRDRTAIAAELQRAGYNQIQAQQEQYAVTRYLASANGTQQLRLRQGVEKINPHLDIIEDLYAQLQKEGIPTDFKAWNNLLLKAKENLGGRAGALAQALETQVNDLAPELATIYMGGNSPTDKALTLAQTNLAAKWNPQTFKLALEMLRKNVTLRRNAIRFTGPAGIQQDSPYMPPGLQEQAPQLNPGEVSYTMPDGSIGIFDAKTGKRIR
jgi:hypothetical protein